jgi:hypothetical protein
LRDEAFLIAVNIAKRVAADIEGHSEAAKFGQPRRLSARPDGRQTALIAFWYWVTEGGKPQPGSAGLGDYQAGSLRFVLGWLCIMPFKAADPRIFLSDRAPALGIGRAMFDVGYFPPNMPPDH